MVGYLEVIWISLSTWFPYSSVITNTALYLLLNVLVNIFSHTHLLGPKKSNGSPLPLLTQSSQIEQFKVQPELELVLELEPELEDELL